MNKSQIVLSVILFVGILSLVSAQVEIGEIPQDVVGVIIEPPEVPNGGGGGGGNPFDQSLNTTDNVQFNNIMATGNYSYVTSFTYEGNLNLGGTDSYWTFGRNVLSSSEGVTMWSDGSISEFGWSCSRTPPAGLCTHFFQIRIGSTPLVTESFLVSDEVFKYGRDEFKFTEGDELSIYYDLVGSLCGSSVKAGCGGWIAVYNDDISN